MDFFLRANPMVFSIMACSAAFALCLDFAEAVTLRDAMHKFPIQKL
jgi:hypothetical protein